MEEAEGSKSRLEQAGEDLFNFAIDREDVKWLLAQMQEQAEVNISTVEYELQILKIITVGWGTAYLLENSPDKNPLLELYWRAIYDFAKNLSETTELMIGKDIDYFQVLKDRLDLYVAALSQHSDAAEPSTAIGPEFARNCGNQDDLFAFMAGSKMFVSTISRVKEYFEKIELI